MKKKNDPPIRKGQQFLISLLPLPFTISWAKLICNFAENHLPSPTRNPPDNTNPPLWPMTLPSLQSISKHEKPPFNPRTICHCHHHLHKVSPIPLCRCLATIKSHSPYTGTKPSSNLSLPSNLWDFVNPIAKINTIDLFVGLWYAKPRNLVSIICLMHRHGLLGVSDCWSTCYLRCYSLVLPQ